MRDLERGITEEEFKNCCEDIKTSIQRYKELKEAEDVSENDLMFGRLRVVGAAQNLIDESNGFIKTEDEELGNLFEVVFQTSAAIRRTSDTANHYRAAIKNAKNETELDKCALSLSIANNMFNSSIDKIEELTKSITEEKGMSK